MNEDEARNIIDYFRESTIEIEIFNGLSEMRIGVFKVPLRYFLKWGEKYMRRGLRCEITDNDRKYVIGEIYIVMENETIRPVPPNPDDERTTEKKSKKYKKKIYSEPMNIERMVRKTQEAFGSKLTAAADTSTIKTTFAGTNEEKRKRMRVERSKATGGIAFSDIFNIGSKRGNENLENAEYIRKQMLPEVVERVLNTSSFGNYHVSVGQGVESFVSHMVKNTHEF